MNSKKWPALNKLWEAISNDISKLYLKLKSTLEEYISAVYIFFSSFYPMVQNSYLAQFMVIFYAIAPLLYNIMAQDKKAAMLEAFEKAQA